MDDHIILYYHNISLIFTNILWRPQFRKIKNSPLNIIYRSLFLIIIFLVLRNNNFVYSKTG